MPKENKKETINNVSNGIVGKAYLDIDRTMNVSDLIREGSATSKHRSN